MKVDATDIARRLRTEFRHTGITIVGAWDAFAFKGPQARKCRARTEVLIGKAMNFNAEYRAGRFSSKRNWWKKV